VAKNQQNRTRNNKNQTGIDFPAGDGYTEFGSHAGGKSLMQWTAPAFEEVCLNCEINSYASAKL
jgi:coenzyme PQQ precursor peptide PqqA